MIFFCEIRAMSVLCFTIVEKNVLDQILYSTRSLSSTQKQTYLQ